VVATGRLNLIGLVGEPVTVEPQVEGATRLNSIDAYAFGPKHALVEACWEHFGAHGSSGMGCNTCIAISSGTSWEVSSAMDVECGSQRLGGASQGDT